MLYIGCCFYFSSIQLQQYIVYIKAGLIQWCIADGIAANSQAAVFCLPSHIAYPCFPAVASCYHVSCWLQQSRIIYTLVVVHIFIKEAGGKCFAGYGSQSILYFGQRIWLFGFAKTPPHFLHKIIERLMELCPNLHIQGQSQ